MQATSEVALDCHERQSGLQAGRSKAKGAQVPRADADVDVNVGQADINSSGN